MTNSDEGSRPLVGNPLHVHKCVVVFETMGQRAWWAYQCLPKDPMGHAPKFRELERREELANNSLRRLIWGEAVRPGLVQLEKLARALNCDPEWLQFGRGQQPLARWPVPPRPDAPPGMKPRESARRAAPSLERGSTSERAFSRKSQKLLQSSAPRRRRNAGE